MKGLDTEGSLGKNLEIEVVTNETVAQIETRRENENEIKTKKTREKMNKKATEKQKGKVKENITLKSGMMQSRLRRERPSSRQQLP